MNARTNMGEPTWVDAYVEDLILRASVESPIQPTCRSFLLPLLAPLIPMPSVSIMHALCRKGDFNHNLSFLLALPELWEDMRTEDWIHLCEALSPRPVPKLFDPSGLFTDIMFLLRWLRIDIFRLLRSRTIGRSDDIRLISDYCRINAPLFFCSHGDLGDFVGETFACFVRLQSARRLLLAEDANLDLQPTTDTQFRENLAIVGESYF